MRAISDRCVRVDAGDGPVWGTIDGDEIALDDGPRLPAGEVTFLAPGDPR